MCLFSSCRGYRFLIWTGESAISAPTRPSIFALILKKDSGITVDPLSVVLVANPYKIAHFLGKAMRVCGVELSANDAVVCLLELKDGLFDLPDCRAKKLTLPKQHQSAELRQFQFTFAKLMQDYKIEHVAIKERPTKGKFAGGAASFKMEAAIQLIPSVSVSLLSAQKLKATLNESPLPISFSDTGLKSFQETAFLCAYVSCCGVVDPVPEHQSSS